MSDLHRDVAAYWETTLACPVQIEGQLLNGDWFYFRYRSGRATIGLGGSPEQASYDEYVVGRYVAVRHGDRLDGCFESNAERNAVFAAALTERRTRAA